MSYCFLSVDDDDEKDNDNDYVDNNNHDNDNNKDDHEDNHKDKLKTTTKTTILSAQLFGKNKWFCNYILYIFNGRVDLPLPRAQRYSGSPGLLG